MKELEISKEQLAKLHNLSLEEINQIILGEFENKTITSEILTFLGIGQKTSKEVIEKRALLKAHYIARLVQGSQALECAALDKNAYKELIDYALNILLKKKSSLWDNNDHEIDNG